jgi:hypothetical protein
VSAAIDTPSARRLLETLERDAVSARNRADISGDGHDLARVVELALFSVPTARVLADEGARRELRAIDPELAIALEPWFTAPFAREASMRVAIHNARGEMTRGQATIAALMRAYRAREEAVRREARASLDPLLDHLYDRTAVQQITEAIAPAKPVSAEPFIPLSTQRTASGLLVLPSAELIQGLAGGGLIDARIFGSAIASAPEEAPVPKDSAPQPSTLPELLRALAESVLGSPAASFGEWRAACAAIHVADFRAVELPVLGRVRANFLPFEHPAVPIYRPSAIIKAEVDAWSSTAAIFSAGTELAGPAFGGALVFGSATKSFVLRGLADRPPDVLRATRALALCCGFLFAPEVEDPPRSLDRWWSCEPALSRAPGEHGAIYLRSDRLRNALLSGATLIGLLRDNFDEDWFRNPRLSPERIRELALLAAPATENAIATWLNEHARL